MPDIAWPAAAIYNTNGPAPFVVVCEHASAFIPPIFANLGLDAEARQSHAAWDIGASNVAQRLCARLDAPLIAGTISRLVYDCNRPLEAPDCIPEQSEIFAIPGNRGLSAADKRQRFDEIHDPFHDTLGRVLTSQIKRCSDPVSLITIHSFTPVYHGVRRALDIGFLFHSHGDIAHAATAIELDRGVMQTAVNEPYAAVDGVTYTLQKHADARGLRSVMVEIRNDLVEAPAKAEKIADHLAATLMQAIGQTQHTEAQA